MVNVVNKGLKVEILPDNNMMKVLNQNIGNARLSGIKCFQDTMIYISCFLVMIIL